MDEELAKMNISTFSSDIEVMRKYLNLDQFALIGHSVHAQIALDYAVNHPNNVEKLIIIGGVPYHFSEFGDLQSALWNSEASEERKSISVANIEILNEVMESTPADRKFAVSYHYNAPQYWANPNYDASSLLDGLRTSIPSKSEVSQKLQNLSVPTVVILGKLDFAIPYTAWEELINDMTHIEYVLMEDASHNPQTEIATQNEFDKHLVDWVDALNYVRYIANPAKCRSSLKQVWKLKKRNWKKYTFEFLSIFIAVNSAFALNNWNENNRDNKAESRILSEILNGLEKDMEDVKVNVMGHEEGIKACLFWRKVFTENAANLDTLQQYYFLLTRDFVSI